MAKRNVQKKEKRKRTGRDVSPQQRLTAMKDMHDEEIYSTEARFRPFPVGVWRKFLTPYAGKTKTLTEAMLRYISEAILPKPAAALAGGEEPNEHVLTFPTEAAYLKWVRDIADTIATDVRDGIRKKAEEAVLAHAKAHLRVQGEPAPGGLRDGDGPPAP